MTFGLLFKKYILDSIAIIDILSAFPINSVFYMYLNYLGIYISGLIMTFYWLFPFSL